MCIHAISNGLVGPTREASLEQSSDVLGKVSMNTTRHVVVVAPHQGCSVTVARRILEPVGRGRVKESVKLGC
jgi:hypothetical protein